MAKAMVVMVVVVGVSRWRKCVVDAKRIAILSVNGDVNHRSAIQFVARNAKRRSVQCVVKASIQKVAGWSAGSRTAGSYAPKSHTFAQPRIVPNVRPSALSLSAKLLARKVLVTNNLVGMSAASQCAIGIVKSPKVARHQSVP